jgi:hypothetical protein
MIPMSLRIMKALEKQPTTCKVSIDLFTFDDLVAGESEVVIEGQRYGVLRYERTGDHQADAWLVLMEREDADPATFLAITMMDVGFEVDEIDWDSISAMRAYLNEPIVIDEDLT